jgi:hypothetical protein
MESLEKTRVLNEGLLELRIDQPIFIGFKADHNLRQRLETLNSADRKYVSDDDSTFLRLCRLGEDLYVGKLIHESLTTDRVEDIRRNIVSIVHRIGTELRVPVHLKILACNAADPGYVPKPD